MARNEQVPAGTWVKVRARLLEAGGRKAGVPADTANLPYEMRVVGHVQTATSLGEEATVVTATGRRVRGVVEELQPAYWHTFGPMDPDLHATGVSVRRWLAR